MTVGLERYLAPRTLAEALRALGEIDGARAIAGGTDLLVGMRDPGRDRPRALVSLRRIEGLSGIAASAGGIAIGAATPVADLIASRVLARTHPALVEAARRLGTPAIRNMATIGGNLANASPCADLAPPLVCAGATVRVEGPGGPREIGIESFLAGPGKTVLARGDLLTAVLVPDPPPEARAVFLKIGRVAIDLALASVAARAELRGGRLAGVRLAAGAVAPVPLRLRLAEAALEGEPPSPALAAEAGRVAAAEVSPITDVRASAGYRRRLVGVLVERAIASVAGGAPS